MARRKPGKTGRMAEQAPSVSSEVREDLRALMLSTPVDPDLMAEVVTRLRRSRRPNLVAECVKTYFDFYGLDRRLNAEPEDLLGLGALTSRVAALIGLLETMVPPEPSDQRRHLAIIDAASTVRLIERDGEPAFQLFEFLAAVDRLEKEVA
jgi:hypothetical protein